MPSGLGKGDNQQDGVLSASVNEPNGKSVVLREKCVCLLLAQGDSPIFVNSQGQGNEALFIGFDGHVVDCQKDDCRCGDGALVAIDERVILNNVLQIGRRHFKHILVQKLSPERCLRHGNRRMQQPDVADALRAAIGFRNYTG